MKTKYISVQIGAAVAMLPSNELSVEATMTIGSATGRVTKDEILILIEILQEVYNDIPDNKWKKVTRNGDYIRVKDQFKIDAEELKSIKYECSSMTQEQLELIASKMRTNIASEAFDEFVDTYKKEK